MKKNTEMEAMIAASGFDKNHSLTNNATKKKNAFAWRVITCDDLQESDYARREILISRLNEDYQGIIENENVRCHEFLDILCVRMRRDDFYLSLESMFCLYGSLCEFPYVQLALFELWCKNHKKEISSLDRNKYPFLCSPAQTRTMCNHILKADNIICLPKAFFESNVDVWLRECKLIMDQQSNSTNSFLSVCKKAEVYVIDTIFTHFFEWLLRGECWNFNRA